MKKRSSLTERIKSIFYVGEYFDYTMLFLVLFLVCFGLIMVYSTSSYKGTVAMGDAAYWLKRQGIFAAMGIVAMIFISFIDYHKYKVIILPAYIGICGLLLYVMFKGIVGGGAARWIEIGGITFQPSEFAKPILIIFIAALCNKYLKKLIYIRYWIFVMGITIPAIFFIATENLSTAVVCTAIVFITVFVAGPKYKRYIVAILIIIAGGACLIVVERYRADRIKIWFHPENYDKGYQTLQSLYAIGSGGFFGKGLGQSMQKMGFIPESHNDMIFSVVCEELGLFGAACIIFVFMVLIWRFMIIANNAIDLFGSLIVIGTMGHIAVQVLMNIAVVTNSMPNTGVTLPFISYGGTSLFAILCEMGVVLSVSRQIKLGK